MKTLTLIILLVSNVYARETLEHQLPQSTRSGLDGVIVISDIDDTIKIANVKTIPIKILRGLWPYDIFPGFN